MTPFELAVEAAAKGTLKVPVVSTVNGSMDYFRYQLIVHRHNLNMMAIGMKIRGVKLGDLKKYYGLKGRTAKECMPEFANVANAYLS